MSHLIRSVTQKALFWRKILAILTRAALFVASPFCVSGYGSLPMSAAKLPPHGDFPHENSTRDSGIWHYPTNTQLN